MKKQACIVCFLFVFVSIDAQYFRGFGDYFEKFNYMNQTRNIYADSIHHKVYFLGEHTTTTIDSLDEELLVWDGDSIYPLLTFFGSHSCNFGAIEVYNGKIYIGGVETEYWTQSTNTMLVYDGTAWDTLPESPNEYVNNMTVYDNRLYICGEFFQIGSSDCNGVAYLDSTGWHCIDQGICPELYPDYRPYIMAFFHDTLYMGGTFTDTCNAAMFQLMRYNGSYWEPVPGWRVGNNSQIAGLQVFQDKLFVSGSFFYSDGISLGNCIVYFDGSQWYSPGAGSDIGISDMVVANNKLYVGGGFDQIDTLHVNCFAAWDGHQWCRLDSQNMDICGSLLILAALDDTIYMGGSDPCTIGSDTFFRHGYWVGMDHTYECGQYYTGVADISEIAPISVYPNPADDKLFINSSQPNYSISISDMAGQFWPVPSSGQEVDLSALPAGVYCLRIQSADGSITKKFVKE